MLKTEKPKTDNFGRFRFNQWGVCTNPERIAQGLRRNYDNAVELAGNAAGWTFGLEMYSDNLDDGSCSPCSMQQRTYATRHDALRAAIMAMRAYYAGVLPCHRYTNLRRFIRELEERFWNERQLSLFD